MKRFAPVEIDSSSADPLLPQAHAPADMSSTLPTPLVCRKRTRQPAGSPTDEVPLERISTASMIEKNRTKNIADRVHRVIKIEPLLQAVIDTAQFQRLRELKQLGNATHVWPTATHSRFEHSLGVAHLAGRVCETILEQAQRGELPDDIEPPSDRDVLCVRLAGLVHDLGHGPFSHVFDGHVVPGARKQAVCTCFEKEPSTCVKCALERHSHEKMSIRMLAHMVEQNPHLRGNYGLQLGPGEPDFRFVEELVLGDELEGGVASRRGVPLASKGYLYEIVNNTESGLDVDKLDYLLRDPQACNDHKPSFYIDTLLEGLKVCWGKFPGVRARRPVIAYASKVASEVHKVFRTRFDFHNEYYTHKTVQGRDLVLTDLLLACDEVGEPLNANGQSYRIGEAVRVLEVYEKLNDSVVTMVEQWLCVQEDQLADAERPDSKIDDTERARYLKLGPRIQRIRKLLRFWSAHGHYKCLHQRLCTDEELKLSKGALRERLAEEQSRLREQTREPSLHVEPLHLHYGHPSDKGRYPLNDICFFDKSDSKDNEVQPGPPAHLGRSRTNGPFEDKYVRFYARDVDLCQDKVRLCRLQQMVKQQLDQGKAPCGHASPCGGSGSDDRPDQTDETQPGGTGIVDAE